MDPWRSNTSGQPMVGPYILTQCASCYLTKVSSSWKVSRDVKERTDWVFSRLDWLSRPHLNANFKPQVRAAWKLQWDHWECGGYQLLALSLTSCFQIFVIFGLKFCWRLKRLMFKLNSSSLEQIKTFIKSRIFQQMIVFEIGFHIGFSGNSLPGFHYV